MNNKYSVFLFFMCIKQFFNCATVQRNINIPWQLDIKTSSRLSFIENSNILFSNILVDCKMCSFMKTVRIWFLSYCIQSSDVNYINNKFYFKVREKIEVLFVEIKFSVFFWLCIYKVSYLQIKLFFIVGYSSTCFSLCCNAP